MSETAHTIIEGVVSVLLIGRGVMSHYEHKRTGESINEIRISINGEVERRIEEAKEQGKQEAIQEMNK